MSSWQILGLSHSQPLWRDKFQNNILDLIKIELSKNKSLCSAQFSKISAASGNSYFKCQTDTVKVAHT